MCRTQARLNFERARRAVRRLERRGLSDFWGGSVLWIYSLAALSFFAGGGGAAADAAGSAATYRLDGALHVDRVQPPARPERGHVDVAGQISA